MRIKQFVLRIVFWFVIMFAVDTALAYGATYCAGRDENILFDSLGGVLVVSLILFSLVCFKQIERQWKMRRGYRENLPSIF